MNSSSSVILIGGGGFIGSALRSYFAATGVAVTIIGRSVNISLATNETYYSIVEYSFKELETQLAAKKIAAVIDLAYTSVPGTSYEDPVKDFSENLYNVIRHLDFSRTVGAERFIYVSSGGTVYGDSAGKPLTEEAPNFPLSPYGVTKLSCERYVYMYHRLYNLPTIIVRPSNIYGPGQKPFRGQGLIATGLGLALKGEPIHVFGDGSHIRDYLYIDDFCTALMTLISGGTNGEIYNIGSGQGVSINAIIAGMNEVTKEDKRELTTKPQPERPFDVHYNVLNIDKLSGATEWQPQVDLQEGIAQTWKWIKQTAVQTPW